MTMLGYTYGQDHEYGASYLDMVEFITETDNTNLTLFYDWKMSKLSLFLDWILSK